MSKSAIIVVCCSILGAIGLWLKWSCAWYPTAPKRLSVSASASARRAMTEYDTNGDGKLDKSELARCPALLRALPMIDTEHEDYLNADKIARRINAWYRSDCIIMDGSMFVSFDNAPLVGATVTFEPEPFLGSQYTTVSGVTDKRGWVDLRAPNIPVPGLYCGYYRVRVTKAVNGREAIPARYNAGTTLGVEVASDVVPERRARFDLTSQP